MLVLEPIPTRRFMGVVLGDGGGGSWGSWGKGQQEEMINTEGRGIKHPHPPLHQQDTELAGSGRDKNAPPNRTGTFEP